jgi:hypothetical protein
MDRTPDARPTIVLCWFTRESYAQHLRLDPKSMKPRFKHWLKDAEAMEKRLRADGYAVHRMLLDAEQLAAWALLNGAEINEQTRARFAHHLFTQRQGH